MNVLGPYELYHVLEIGARVLSECSMKVILKSNDIRTEIISVDNLIVFNCGQILQIHLCDEKVTKESSTNFIYTYML